MATKINTAAKEEKPTKPPRTAPVGKPDKPKDPAKSKKVPTAKLTEIRGKSKGKYKTNKSIADILATIDCTDESPARFLADRGMRV